MRIKIKQLKEQSSRLEGREVTIKGWVRTLRQQKNFAFLEVNDGSTLSSFQVVIDPSLPNYAESIESLSTGASVAIRGNVVESPGKQQHELKALQVEVIGRCDAADYPLQKKRHSLEFLRSIAHLRPRTNTLGAIARVRNAVAFATHCYYQNLGFLYLQSPIITASDCEGAGQMFRVSTLDLENLPKTQEGRVDYSKDFFEKPAFLTVSGQLNGEIYASALSDVYTFGPTFRAENSNTSRHLAEFWMIEPEMAFADLEDNMDNAEGYLKYVLKYTLDNCREDLEFFDTLSSGLIERLQQIVQTPFERLSYTEAIDILNRSGKQFHYPVEWGCDLQSEHERYLAEQYFKKPVILTNYPATIKAFYMRSNGDKTVAAMDILFPSIGEIVGGSQREERLDLLEQKIEQMGLQAKDYWWYLELRKYGSVPHAGYGVGFERVVSFITGVENIRDISAFPRYPAHADF